MGIATAISSKISKMSLICAFFVVCIHCKPDGEIHSLTWWYTTLFSRGICSIAVPFFFTVSGFFLAQHIFEKNWWPHEISKRLRTLVIPFFSWSLLYFLYAVPLILIANILADTVLTRNFPTTLGGGMRILGLDPFSYPYLIPLWFVRCLFLFVCISPILAWIVKKGKRTSFILLICLFPLGMIRDLLQPQEGDFFWITVGTFSFLNLFYFALGFFFSLYPCADLGPKSRAYAIGCLGCLFLVLQGLSDIFNWGSGFYFNYLSIPCILFALWRLISPKPWDKRVTQASFPIFLLHMFFLSFIGLLLKNLFRVEETSLLISIGSCAGAFAASILFSYLMRRYFPKLSTVLLGGR